MGAMQSNSSSLSRNERSSSIEDSRLSMRRRTVGVLESTGSGRFHRLLLSSSRMVDRRASAASNRSYKSSSNDVVLFRNESANSESTTATSASVSESSSFDGDDHHQDRHGRARNKVENCFNTQQCSIAQPPDRDRNSRVRPSQSKTDRVFHRVPTDRHIDLLSNVLRRCSFDLGGSQHGGTTAAGQQKQDGQCEKPEQHPQPPRSRSRSPAIPCANNKRNRRATITYGDGCEEGYEPLRSCDEEANVAHRERMYAQATWKMYDRITSARAKQEQQRRIQGLDPVAPRVPSQVIQHHAHYDEQMPHGAFPYHNHHHSSWPNGLSTHDLDDSQECDAAAIAVFSFEEDQ